MMRPLRASRRTPTRLLPLALCINFVGISGCATLPDGNSWGQDVTLTPGWKHVMSSAIGAAKSPRVWVPLLGAGLMQINGWDRKVSNWARDNTPVFGSEANAAQWSDELRTASSVAYHLSVLATPDEGPFSHWIESKAKGYGVGLAAVGFTGATTNVLKGLTARERPNGQDTESFPSAHTSRSAVLTELTQCNIESMGLSSGSRLALDFGANLLTIGTGWARVEAGAHYPSDVLFAMALGNWTGRSFNDAFMGTTSSARMSFDLVPAGAHGIELRFSYVPRGSAASR